MDKNLKFKEIQNAFHLLHAYRDIVQHMVVPMQDKFEDYFKDKHPIEREYFYARVKSATHYAKLINSRIKNKEKIVVEIWKKDNEIFKIHLEKLQAHLAKMGYGVHLENL